MVLDLLIRLREQVSQRAPSIISSLRSVQSAANATNASMQGQGAQAGATATIGALGKVTGAYTAAFGLIGSEAMEMIHKIGSVAIEVPIKIGKTLFDFSDYVTKSAMFKEDTLSVMSVLLKSDEKAKAFLGTLTKLAAVTPFETQGVMSMGKKLLGGGFSTEEIPVLMYAAGDLASLGASGAKEQEEMTGRIIGYLNKIKSNGGLNGEVIQGLADAGVSSAAIYQAIQDRIGKVKFPTIDSVKKAIEAKRFDADTGLVAIIDVAVKQFGGLGKGMEKASATFSGVLSTLTSKPFEWAMTAAEGEGFSAIKNAVITLNDVLEKRSPEIIGRINKLYDRVMTSVFSGMDNKSIDEGITKILGAVDRAIGYIQIMGAGVKGLFSGLWAGFQLPDSMTPETIKQLSESWEKSGKRIGDTIISIINRLTVLADQIVRISGAIDTISSIGSEVSEYSPLGLINKGQNDFLNAVADSPIPRWLGMVSSGNTFEKRSQWENEKPRANDNRQMNVTIQQEIVVGKDADEKQIKDANKKAAQEGWSSALTDLGLGF